jgi:GAF domain-containing protein
MSVDECAISYWARATGRVDSLGYYPMLRIEELEPYYDVASYPETLRVLERQETVIIDADDPAAHAGEVELLRRDGNRVVAMLPLVAKGQSICLVELFSKTTIDFDAERLSLARTMANEAAMALENARLYEDARKLADRDPLTGFFNHRFLHERLGEEVVRTQRARRPLSVLMLDLDDFKLVNDTFGHLFGDRVDLDGRAHPLHLAGVGRPRPLRRRRIRDHPAGDGRERSAQRRGPHHRGVP